jgi:hypothetical protein
MKLLKRKRMDTVTHISFKHGLNFLSSLKPRVEKCAPCHSTEDFPGSYLLFLHLWGQSVLIIADTFVGGSHEWSVIVSSLYFGNFSPPY